MPDQTILNHAARILATLNDQRADVALRAYFGQHRYLAPRERRDISHGVFAYFRWLQWLDGKASPQKRIDQALGLQARFVADPKSIKAEALAVRAVPEWLASEMTLSPEYLRQLQREPALWLRTRPGRAGEIAKALGDCRPPDRPAATGSAASPTAEAPDALRYTGPKDLFRTAQFKAGEFEIQDLASQLVSLAAAPRPGETWWDACAGEGGKSLHLAELMQNKGTVWATDRHTGRLEALKRRMGRAQLFNYRAAAWDGSAKLPTKAKFDGILVDAPCSGVGTWQRNPHARWTTTTDDVRELAVAQRALLDQVVGSLKPGGRLVYSVCTLTRSETTAVASAFAENHPELEPAPLAGLHSTEAAITLWPQDLDANGMFIAAWRRKA